MKLDHVWIILSFLVLSSVATIDVKINFQRPLHHWKYFQELFRAKREISKETYLTKLKEYARRGYSREEDKQMSEEIAEDFLSKLYSGQNLFRENDVKEQIEEEFQPYIKRWVTNMYYELLALYELNNDEETLEMMLKEPDYYGLTYDSWKIMTFNFDHIEKIKPSTL